MSLKEKFKQLSRNTRRFITVGTFLTGIVGTQFLCNYLAQPSEYKTGSQTYQGYHNNREGNVVTSRTYVFDSLPQQVRGNRGPQYPLDGDVKLAESLKIGQKYKFVYGKPKNPFMGPQIYSVEPDTSKSE